MNDEAKQVISFIFKRSGKKTLPASDVYLAISMELQWCTPKEAKAFVKWAVDQELLTENSSGVTPSFPLDDIEIPTGFSPSKGCFSKMESSKKTIEQKDITSTIISRVNQKTQLTEEIIKKEIKQIATEKVLFEEVAAVFYAKKMGCNIDDLVTGEV